MKDNDIQESYLELVMLFERLHRLFLELLRAELDKMAVKNLSNVQALILYNIGEREVTVGEISNRGYYLGSNVSYNLRKMVENGYLEQKAAENDRRSFYVSLSKSGKTVFKRISELLGDHIQGLVENRFSEKDVQNFLGYGRQFETFWSHLLLKMSRLR